MRGLYSHSRKYRKIFWRDHFPHISQILEGIHFGANTCRACIRTRANTGKHSWGTIYVLVSCQGVLKKSSFQYGMKFSIENGFFILGPFLAAEKQGLGLKFSIGNEIFRPRMKISIENENFVRGGMVFSCVRAGMNFFNPRALWDSLRIGNSGKSNRPLTPIL